MGERRQRAQPRPALEIEEQDVNPVWRKAERQGHGQASQELRLPGARGAGNEHMRTVSLKVEDARTPWALRPMGTARPGISLPIAQRWAVSAADASRMSGSGQMAGKTRRDAGQLHRAGRIAGSSGRRQ